ncbi:MAG: DUF882 domain-containing protein [Alphaproteobacteria bacterium]
MGKMNDERGCPSRRRFLLASAGAALGLAGMPGARAAGGRRRIALYNANTGEGLDLVYWAGGRYLGEALRKIDRLLRDHRTGQTTPTDLALIDLLYRSRRRMRSRRPWHVISGYRSPASNQALARKIPGVAAKSLHTLGKAVDVRLPGRTLMALRRVAHFQRAGGVGLYPGSAFVHLDTGKVRHWIGRGVPVGKRSALDPDAYGCDCPCCAGEHIML